MRRGSIIGGGLLSMAMASLAMPGRAMTVRERMPSPEPRFEPTPRRDPAEVINEIEAAAQAKRLRKQAKRLGR